MAFVLSKAIWVFTSPLNLFVLALLVAGFLCISPHATQQRLGKNLCFNLAMLLFLVSVFPVGDWMLAPIENVFPTAKPDHVDGIILLGGDERPALSEARGQPIVLDSARRYMEFVALSHEYPEAKLIFTGGSGRLTPEAKTKDAEVAKSALKRLGVPVDKMIFEDQSRNTRENATMVANIIHPTPDQKWLLVTSAFHMPRAMGCFRNVGFNVFPRPVGYMTGGKSTLHLDFNALQHLQEMAYAMHEYYGLIAYWFMGYTDTPWIK